MSKQTNYTQEQMQDGEIVGQSEVTGMLATVWKGNYVQSLPRITSLISESYRAASVLQ